MSAGKHVLFYLDAEQRLRLSCDDLQWIVERGNPKAARPGRDSGYRGIAYVCVRKETLYRVVREQHVDLSLEACGLLAALPGEFSACGAMLDRLGIDEFQAWLRRQAAMRRGGRGAQLHRADERRRHENLRRRLDPQRRSRQAARAVAEARRFRAITGKAADGAKDKHGSRR